MGEHFAAGWRDQVPAFALAAVALGVVVRSALLAAPPLFVTDVSYYNTQAVGYLLHGVDPYGASYAVPPSLQTPGAEKVFAYLPGVFAFLVPGDIGTGARAGLVACDLVVAASLVAFRRRPGSWAAALFLLLPPVVLLSTSFLNDSLPAIAFVSLAVVLEDRGRHLPAGALMGAALASSQEVWLVFPVYLAYCLRNRRYLPPGVSLAVGGAVVAPFAAWNPTAFLSNTLLFQFQRDPAPFLSSGPFGLNINPSLQGVLASVGGSAPLLARGALAVALLAAILWRSRGSATYLLWGSAASVTACLLVVAGNFFWSYLELPLVLLLFWGVLRGEKSRLASTLKEAEATAGATPK